MKIQTEWHECLIDLSQAPSAVDIIRAQAREEMPIGWEDMLYEEQRDRQYEEQEYARAEAEAPASPLVQRRQAGQRSRLGRRWDCWTLNSENIEGLANRLGYDPAQISDDDIQEIASRFQSGLLGALADWEELLGEAITQVKGEAP